MAICRGQYSWRWKRSSSQGGWSWSSSPRLLFPGVPHLVKRLRPQLPALLPTPIALVKDLPTIALWKSTEDNGLPLMWWKIKTHTQERSTDVLRTVVKDYWSPGKLQSHGIIQHWTPWENTKLRFWDSRENISSASLNCVRWRPAWRKIASW